MADNTNIKNLEKRLSQAKQTLHNLEFLNKLSLAMSSTMEVEEIMKIILSETSRQLHAAHSSIMLLKEQEPDLLSTLVREKKFNETGSLDLASRTIAGWVLKSQKPLLVNDILTDPRFSGLDRINQTLQSVLAFPMRTKGRIVGVMVFQNLKNQDTFKEEHQRLVSIIAAQSAQVLENAHLYRLLTEENIYLRHEVEKKYQFKEIIGKSPAMQQIFQLLERVIPSEARVVLAGETGTGKELIARAIHYNGPRKNHKFLAIDCGAIPENLLESELFGHKKGAFTGATVDKKGLFVEATGGTLFLDEINNMAVSLQAKLLRAIQEGEVRPVGSNQPVKVDVRIISASSKDLKTCIEAGTFREDLYYRLKVITINLPSLRQRKEDLPVLLDHFLSKFCKVAKKNVRGFNHAARTLLERYDWPGNIRELENLVERAVTLAGEQEQWIGPEHLPEEFRQERPNDDNWIPKEGSLLTAVAALEQKMIRAALNQFNGNKTKAAKSLGLSRRGLLNKIERYKL